jgi:predicted DNA-binding WGR domain protein
MRPNIRYCHPLYRPSRIFKDKVADEAAGPFKGDCSDWKGTRRFELVDGSNSSFFEISVEGLCITRKFGTIGKTGYKRESLYRDEAALELAYGQFVDGKFLSGYQEIKTLIPDKIRWRSLARLHRRQMRPDVKKAIRIYANTKSILWESLSIPADLLLAQTAKR